MPRGWSSRGLDRSSASEYRIRGSCTTRSGRAVLDDPPAVHHGDLVGEAGDDGDVVGLTKIIAMFRSSPEAAQQGEDLRLDGDVERGRRLVGDQQVGLAGQRHGDGDALAHAARQLVRVAVEATLRVGDADLLEQLDGPATRPPAVEPEAVVRGSRRSWVPIRFTGLSDDSGFCGTMLIRRSQIRRSCDGLSVIRSVPSNHTWPLDRARLPSGWMRMIERVSTLLPDPDSPTMPSVRPRSSSRLTSVTARSIAEVGAEPRREAPSTRSERAASRSWPAPLAS